MTMILTDSVLTVSQRWYNLFVANAPALGLDAGGVVNVWYGDQDQLPRTPALCIEPGTKRRAAPTPPEQTLNELDVHLLLYHSSVGTGQQAARQATIQFAEAIERFMHVNHLNLANSAGDQIIVHGYVREMDPGFSYKNSTLYNAVQMTWTGLTKTSLRNPQSPPP